MQFVQIVFIVFAINMLIIHKKNLKSSKTIKQNQLGTKCVGVVAQEKEGL